FSHCRTPNDVIRVTLPTSITSVLASASWPKPLNRSSTSPDTSTIITSSTVVTLIAAAGRGAGVVDLVSGVMAHLPSTQDDVRPHHEKHERGDDPEASDDRSPRPERNQLGQLVVRRHEGLGRREARDGTRAVGLWAHRRDHPAHLALRVLEAVLADD